MMTIAEIANLIRALVRIARLDDSGFDLLPDTMRTARLSFWAAVLTVPFNLMVDTARYATTDDPPLLVGYLLASLLGHVVAWTFWPVIMLHLGPVLNGNLKVWRAIAAYNWMWLLAYPPVALVTVLREVRLMPVTIGQFATLIIMSALIGYGWFLFRRGLGTEAGTSAMLVLLHLIVGQIMVAVVIEAQGGI